MKTIRPTVSGQGRITVVGHRTGDRPGLSTAKSVADFQAVGDLPGTPGGGVNFATRTGKVPHGDVAERYEAGTATYPDYYQSEGNKFTTRVH